MIQLKRYFLFIVALFINAFGIAFVIKADLGTSPISSIAYVPSLFTDITVGQWTIIFNLLFMLLELPFMTRAYFKSDLRMFLLQIPVTLLFGSFIDVSMNALQWVQPAAYFSKVGDLLIGCTILAIGIALEVKANAAMTAGEYFVRVISWRLRRDFGFVKTGFDSTLVVLACITSLVAMHGIYGIREGTVVAAFIVGPIVHFISPAFKVLDKWLHEGRYAPEAHKTVLLHRP